MPELPDVEVFRRDFSRQALGRGIERVDIITPRILAGTSPHLLQACLTHREFRAAQRYGKRLYAAVDNDGWLSFHFGLSGRLWYGTVDEAPPPGARLLIGFRDGGRLAYLNPRMIGRIEWITDPALDVRAKRLGPDALDRHLTLTKFTQAVGGHRRGIKAVLMDQSVVAGIGNKYSDEILFQSRLHPLTPANVLDAPTLADLYRKLRVVVKRAIASGAEAEHLPGNFLIPQRRTNGSCPRCGGPIRELRSGGRRGYFCPHCQPRPAANGRFAREAQQGERR
jgi:formamidopyrimidine-DNA glycosylase